MIFYILVLTNIIFLVTSNNLYEFTLNVIKLSVFTNDCVKFFCDMNYECDYIKGATMTLNIPTMDATIMYNSTKDTLCTKYYMVVTNNFTKIRDLFKRKNGSSEWEFKTNSRVVIFYSGEDSFTELVIATHRDGFDILVVQDFKLYDPEFLETDGIFKNNITVTSIRNDQILARFNHDVMIFYDDLFQLIPWQPIFNNWTFIVGASNCPPFVLDTNQTFDGVDIDIVKTVTIGWSIEYKHYNTRIPYQLMQNDLLEDKVNLAVCSQWQSSVWEIGMSISFPYSQHCGTFLVPKPYVDERISNIFKPIQLECWILIAAACLVIALILTIFARIYLLMGRKSLYVGYAYSVQTALKIICLNSPNFPPPTVQAFRLIITYWWVTAVIITTGYSAGYTTALTYPKLTKVINTFEDVANENIHWGGSGEGVRRTIAGSLNSAIERMQKNYFNDCSISDINRRIRAQKDFAVFVKVLPEKYITDIDILDDFARKNLKVLSECAQVNYAVFAFNRNSPFPRIFDRYIKVFLECGLIRAWFTRKKHNDFKEMVHFYRTYGDTENVATPLDMQKLKGSFILLGIGLSFALIIFIIEHTYHKVHVDIKVSISKQN